MRYAAYLVTNNLAIAFKIHFILSRDYNTFEEPLNCQRQNEDTI